MNTLNQIKKAGIVTCVAIMVHSFESHAAIIIQDNSFSVSYYESSWGDYSETISPNAQNIVWQSAYQMAVSGQGGSSSNEQSGEFEYEITASFDSALLEFNFDTITEFSLSGTLNEFRYARKTAFARLSIGNADIFNYSLPNISSTGEFNYFSYLLPGTYYFAIQSYDYQSDGIALVSDDKSWNYSITASQVPVPGAAIFLVSALMPLFCYRQSKSAST